MSADAPGPESSGESEGVGRTFVLTSVGAAVLFLLLRVLAVSGWDWHTAFALTHTVDFDDAISIALGTLMANEVATGVLLIWLLPVSVIGALWPFGGGRRTSSALLLAATMVAATVALVSTEHAWWVLTGAAVIAVLVILARLFWHHGPVHRATEIAVRRIGLTALLAALVLAALVRTPWVPLERIETGDDVVLGYVVDSEPGFHKVLTEDERELLIVSDAEVDHREELPPA